MTLTHEERHSALWLKLKEYMEVEIVRLRVKNDGQLDELTTANIRGRIAALKEFAALDAQQTVTDE